MATISQNTCSPVFTIPEMLFGVFSHGDIADLLTCGKVCKQWREVANIDALWARLFQQWKEPLKTKQEVFTRFNGAITSEVQLLRKVREWIMSTPLGHDYAYGTERWAEGFFVVHFPFNPCCQFIATFRDERVAEEKKWQAIGIGAKDYIQKHSSIKRYDYVFAKALPDRSASLYELEYDLMETFQKKGKCAEWRNGVTYLIKRSEELEVLCPGGLIKAEKRYFHRFMMESYLFTDVKDFNSVLQETIEGAIKERTQAVVARKTRRDEMILATMVSVVLVALKYLR